MSAELKRLRTELNRLKAAAGDAPPDQAVIRQEADAVMLPVIGAYAGRTYRMRGVLPDPGAFAAEWLCHL